MENLQGKIVFFLFFICLFFYGYANKEGKDVELPLLSELNNPKVIGDFVKYVEDNPGKLDSKVIFSYAEKAVAVSDSLGYNKEILRSVYDMSEYVLVQDDWRNTSTILDLVIKRAERNKDKELKAQCIVRRGSVCLQKDQADSAMVFFQLAEKIIGKGNRKILANIWLQKATVFYHNGDYNTSVELQLKAAKYYEEEGLLGNLAITYGNIAENFSTLEKEKQAIFYTEKAIEINKENRYLYVLSHNYASIGTYYKRLDSLEIAKQYYDKSLELCRELDRPGGIVQNLINIAIYYMLKNEFELSRQTFEESLQMSEALNMQYAIMICNTNLAIIDTQEKDYKKALKHNQTAFDIAHKLNDKNTLYQIHRMQAYVDSAMGNYEGAYNHYKAFYTLKDSIMGERTQNHILELEKKYQTEMKEREIIVLSQKDLRKKYIISVLAGILLLLMFFFQLIRRKRDLVIREKQQALERNKHLEETIELKNREVLGLASQFVKIKDSMADTIEKVNRIIENDLNSKVVLVKKVNSLLSKSLQPPDLDAQFNQKLSEANQDYYNRLLKHCPDLSPAELKVCALLRSNLSTKEIAQVCNRSTRTIDFTRNNIRKKLNIHPSENLSIYLSNLS